MTKNNIHIFPLGFPWQTKNPFLFCAYHQDFYPKGNGTFGPVSGLEGRDLGSDFTIKDGYRMYHGTSVPGFPSHPHCGFETITIVNKGYCDHSDSLGASARFGEGDVQWMTAGAGVQHSEMFPLVNTDSENPLELFQIWLNLPKKNKFVPPHFAMHWHEDIPITTSGEARVKVIAGTFNSAKALAPAPNSWASVAENEIAILDISIQENGTITLPRVPLGIDRVIYFFDGETINIAQETIPINHGVELLNEHKITITAGEKPVRILVLQGKPIEEPVAKYGPFVMNTQDEIETVIQNFQLTQFGGWPWRHNDPVHEEATGRFARYPDGTETYK